MSTIHHQLSIDAPVANVYEAIATADGISTWTGTRFIFEMAERADGAAVSTTLDFRQSGYDAQSEFYGSNNFAWAHVMQNLKQVVESPRA